MLEIEPNIAVQVHTVQEWTAVVRLFQKHGYIWNNQRGKEYTCDSDFVKEDYFKPGKFLFTREYDGFPCITHGSFSVGDKEVTLTDLFGETHATLLSF